MSNVRRHIQCVSCVRAVVNQKVGLEHIINNPEVFSAKLSTSEQKIFPKVTLKIIF